MFVTEINDSLSIWHPTDHGAANTETLEQELNLTDGVRLHSSSYLNTDTLGRLKHVDSSDQSPVSLAAV